MNKEFIDWPVEFKEKYQKLGYWTGEPLGEILTKTANKYPDKIALIEDEKRITYSELNKRALEFANGLKNIGIKSKDKVVVQLGNSIEFFEVLFALFFIEAVPVLTLPAHRHSEINFFCSFTEAVAYIAHDQLLGFDYRELARKICKLPNIKHSIIVGDAQEFIPYSRLFNQPLNKIESSMAGSVALLQISGGTTGIPKLIPRTHNDYLYSIRESVEICKINEETIFLAVMPVSHNFLLSSPGALGVILAGGTLVLSNLADSTSVFALIEKHKVNFISAVPSLTLTWMNSYENLDLKPNLKSLKIMQVGGAKLSKELAKRITPIFNCKLQQVFGMAEGLVNYTRFDDDNEIIIGTQGKPISKDDEIKIVDDEDNEVTMGEPGHLLTRGPYTIRGYYNSSDHNSKAFTTDGFYRTGDIVKQTKDGYLIVEGREKDQINKGGEKIAAEEIENHLLSHPNVLDAAVVAMPDPLLGERICAFVIPSNKLTEKAYKNPNPRDFIRYMHNRELAHFKIPDRIEFVDEFPKTKFGKVSKKSLKEKIANSLKMSLSH